MYYQNRRSWRDRQKPVPRIVFRIYALLWLIPIVFFLAAPTGSGLLVAICIAVIVWIFMATWHRPEAVREARKKEQRPGREASPQVRLKQPSPSRYEGELLETKMTRYDDYEQPQVRYPDL